MAHWNRWFAHWTWWFFGSFVPWVPEMAHDGPRIHGQCMPGWVPWRKPKGELKRVLKRVLRGPQRAFFEDLRLLKPSQHEGLIIWSHIRTWWLFLMVRLDETSIFDGETRMTPLDVLPMGQPLLKQGSSIGSRKSVKNWGLGNHFFVLKNSILDVQLHDPYLYVQILQLEEWFDFRTEWSDCVNSVNCNKNWMIRETLFEIRMCFKGIDAINHCKVAWNVFFLTSCQARTQFELFHPMAIVACLLLLFGRPLIILASFHIVDHCSNQSPKLTLSSMFDCWLLITYIPYYPIRIFHYIPIFIDFPVIYHYKHHLTPHSAAFSLVKFPS